MDLHLLYELDPRASGDREGNDNLWRVAVQEFALFTVVAFLESAEFGIK